MGEQELGNTIHREIKNLPTKAFISVKEAKLSDGGEYTLLLRNPGGEKSVKVNVMVLDKPGEPQGPVNVTGIMKDRCCISWKAPLQDGGSKISHYIVERRETSRLVWTVIDPKVESTCLKVTKLLEGDEYIFRIRAVNQFGVGAPLESAPVLIKDPYLPPEAPKALEVSDIKKDSMLLTWEAPSEDGGSPITGYIIEKHDKEGVRWTRCNRATVTDLTFRVTGLLESHIYEFRVAAENAIGVGEASSPTVFFRAVDPVFKPGPPHHPRVLDTSKSSVLLSWGKPACDGGCEIQAYIVECCTTTAPVEPAPEAPAEEAAAPEAPVEEWVMCTPPAGIKHKKYEVTNLKENQAYKFRVCAVNKVGVGEAADVSGVIVAQDKVEEPDLDIDPELRNIVSIKAGASLRLFIPIKGRPTPTVKWGKDESPLKETAQVEITSSYTSLVIDKMSRNDSGKYSITVENASGTKSAYIVVRVLDTPSAPINLKVQEITNQSVTLAWEPPLLDGGSKIKNYIVEKRESTRKTYAAVVTNCHALSWKVEPLQEGCSAYVKGYIVEMREYTPIPEETEEAEVAPAVEPVVEKEWSMCTPPTGIQATKLTITDLKEGGEYQFRVCAINSEGVGEAANVHGTVVTSSRAEAPEMELDAELRKVVSVRAGGTLRLFVTIRGRPEPTVKWEKKRDTNSQEWQMAAGNVARTAFKAGRLTHGAEYQFRIYAVNRYGKSTYLDSPGITAQYNFKLPGPPSTPIVKLATKSFMIVTWNEPVNDGGSPVLGYHLERKERTSILWTKMNRGMLKNTEYKVSGVDEGMMYEYRVYAENIAGIGKCSKACEAVAARDPCDPPGMPVVTAVTRSSVSLSWDKPEYDGGAKVSGYVIERRDLPEGRWTRCNFTNVAETHYDATGLTENSQYDFRVIAKNAAGLFSEPSDNTGPITVKDDVDPPRIMMDVKYRETVKVKAGETLRISADLAGRPAPVVSWTKDGKEIELRARIQIVSTDTSTAIVVKDCIRRDSGQYVLTLQNIAGTVTMPINCVVMDKPGPCAGPLQITGLTAEACTLSWGPPQEAGGAEITHYVVERRETSRLAWTLIKGDITKTFYKVKGLLKGEEYVFRVLAVSKHGSGEPLESEIVKITDPFTIPTAPMSVDVTDITGDTMTLTWCKPAADGGSAVIGYVIERREKTGMRWPVKLKVVDSTKTSITLGWSKPEWDGGSEVISYMVEKRVGEDEDWIMVTSKGEVKTTEYTVHDLKPDTDYFFRVSAVNCAGRGEPLELTEPVQAKDILGKSLWIYLTPL
uniref:Titin n=1 Tax=Periophthalmus magnuspinnatus TaxID=409849 RepID=A0A3B4AC97_9GOBI